MTDAMTDFNKLIPELKQWDDGKGIDAKSWIGCVGNFQKMIGYSTVFWPTFTEVDGFVVEKNVTHDHVLQWLDACKGDRHRAQKVINHIDLWTLHHHGCEDVSPERLAYLGPVLREIYEQKLKRDFPERTFVVEYIEPDDTEDIDGYCVTFYEVGERQDG
jgi:hypothetical protein